MSTPIPLEMPATLVFETVVTLGVSSWAWSLASASRQPPLRWAALTMAGAFTIHRIAAWLFAATHDPNDVFSDAGQLWRMVGPFLGTVIVFVGAPIVLGLLVPSVPRVRKPGPAPGAD